VGDEVHLAQHRLEIEFCRFLSHALRLDKVAQLLGHEILNGFLLLAHTLERLEAAVVLLLDSLPRVVLCSRSFLPQKILVQDLFFLLFEVCHRLLLALVFLRWQVRDRLGFGILGFFFGGSFASFSFASASFAAWGRMVMYVHVRRAPTLALKTKALGSLAQESDRRDAMPCICLRVIKANGHAAKEKGVEGCVACGCRGLLPLFFARLLLS